MQSCLPLLPIGIVRDKIIPFTYCPQPTVLLEDLRSYHLTTARAKALYREKWPAELWDEDGITDLDWLSNDICRFLNNDRPTAFGFMDFYKNVFKRLYKNRDRPIDKVSLPCLFNDSYSDIKVSIGLMTIDERRLLETFLGVGL